MKQDDVNTDLILAHAATMREISAVVLVVNGRSPRFTEHLQQVFGKLIANLPDSVQGNIIILFTNCASETFSLYREGLPFALRDDNTFYIDNTAFSVDVSHVTQGVRARVQDDFNAAMRTIQALARKIATMDRADCNDFISSDSSGT